MTYQDTVNPAETLIAEIAATRSFFGRIGAFLGTVFHVLAANSSGQARIEKVQWLQGRTDAELAKMNIKRDDIVQHVFGDIFYL